MLDVHVLLSASTRPDWQRECLSSINLAIRRAGYPVALHKIAAKEGHIGEGRAEGYAQGHFPWVTCVDDDDIVLPDAFARLADGFQKDVSAISVGEVEMRNGVFRSGAKRHHLNAYWRDQIIDHREWLCCGDVAQAAAIAKDQWHDVDALVYLWRVYEGSKARDMRLAHPDELRRANGH